ncbi:MAG: hypothetical protein KDC98_25680 [Planctomycetes bacterium]|nr:hypothetical protein [Planctomycetota bacterium]
MIQHCHLVAPIAAAAIATSSLLLAQNPLPYPVRPGPRYTDATTGLVLPVGYRATEILDTGAVVPVPRVRVDRHGVDAGDLILTSQCRSGNDTTHIYRVAMIDGDPVQPVVFQQVTTLAADNVSLAEDSAGTFYAAANCTQTSSVWRVDMTTGSRTALTTGLNDPDRIAIVTPPGGPERLYAATQDALVVIDLVTGAVVNSVTSTSLGNWGMIGDQPNRTIVGRAAGVLVEFDLVAGIFRSIPASAAIYPLDVDTRGTRWFVSGTSVGWLDSSGTGAFVPIITDPSSSSFDLHVRDEHTLYLCSQDTNKIYRIDLPLHVGPAVLDGATGGTMSLAVQVDAVRSGEAVLAVVTLAGASPGFTFQGLTIPINTPAILIGIGTVDPTGAATLPFQLAAGSSPGPGNHYSLHFCAATLPSLLITNNQQCFVR